MRGVNAVDSRIACFLLKLWILERREPFDPVDKQGWQAVLFDENLLGKHGMDLGWQRIIEFFEWMLS